MIPLGSPFPIAVGIVDQFDGPIDYTQPISLAVAAVRVNKRVREKDRKSAHVNLFTVTLEKL